MLKPKVLFVCTENSCRSQMAEGFLRQHGGDHFEVFSAGAEPTKLNPMAVEVMKEVGIDISGQHSKDVAQFLGRTFQYVIRVCDKVKERCPVLPGAIWYLDWSFEDPAAVQGTMAEKVEAFRRVRDQLEAKTLEFVAHEESPRANS
jgi:arsenate reductase (thioredoxin)